MVKVALDSEVTKGATSNSNIAVAVAAGAVGFVATRVVWNVIKNRKAQK